MRFEVIMGEDAEKARLAGTPLEKWTGVKWMEKDLKVPCSVYDIYRITVKPPEKRRVPLADLRALAGAMLVWPNGDMRIIELVENNGRFVSTMEHSFDADDLVDCDMRYCVGGTVKPCWTEVDE